MNGKVIPLSGSSPIIAPMLMSAWVLSQANTPVTSNLENVSGALSSIRTNLLNKAASRLSSTATPTKPNFSEYIAKMESFAASGR